MAAVEDRSSPSPSPKPPSKRRLSGWSDLWVKKNGNPLKNVLLNMQQLQSLSPKHPKSQTLISTLSQIDKTLLLPDEILLKILSLLPHSQRNHNFLVCKRWLNLQGRLVRTLKVLDWDFLDSGRFITRFPNLTHLDLLNGCLISPRNSGILLSHKLLSVNLGSGFVNARGLCENKILHVEDVDRGLGVVASGCPNLRKFAVLGASELGLLSVAEDCSTLQELELHKCNDNVLRGIAACENLQVLKLVGNVDALYSSVVSDIGLTILAQGSKRLVKLELSGCGGSFDGIKAIGQCCQMLEELTLSNHGMEDGWLAGLPYCENLKTLRLVSCKKVDDNPGPKEYLGSCLALERLHLQNCHMGRKKKGLRALFRVCETVKEVVLHDCWGLDPEKFILAKAFRYCT